MTWRVIDRSSSTICQITSSDRLHPYPYLSFLDSGSCWCTSQNLLLPRSFFSFQRSSSPRKDLLLLLLTSQRSSSVIHEYSQSRWHSLSILWFRYIQSSLAFSQLFFSYRLFSLSGSFLVCLHWISFEQTRRTGCVTLDLDRVGILQGWDLAGAG